MQLHFFLLLPDKVRHPGYLDGDWLLGCHHVPLQVGGEQVMCENTVPTLYILANCPSSRYDRPDTVLDSSSLEGWTPPMVNYLQIWNKCFLLWVWLIGWSWGQKSLLHFLFLCRNCFAETLSKVSDLNVLIYIQSNCSKLLSFIVCGLDTDNGRMIY